jgi:hypothetical protein
MKRAPLLGFRLRETGRAEAAGWFSSGNERFPASKTNQQTPCLGVGFDPCSAAPGALAEFPRCSVSEKSLRAGQLLLLNYPSDR